MVSLYNNHLNGLLADEMGLARRCRCAAAGRACRAMRLLLLHLQLAHVCLTRLPSPASQPTASTSPPQVMALIAYLMQKKSNFGPHLIIVPNAGGLAGGGR